MFEMVYINKSINMLNLCKFNRHLTENSHASFQHCHRESVFVSKSLIEISTSEYRLHDIDLKWRNSVHVTYSIYPLLNQHIFLMHYKLNFCKLNCNKLKCKASKRKEVGKRKASLLSLLPHVQEKAFRNKGL